MQEPEFIAGERLPEHSRIEPALMTLEQELLNTPIPFANRVEFLSDFVKDTKSMTLKTIARKLQVSPSAALKMIESVGASGVFNKDGEWEYEPYTLEVIEEEIVWQELFDSLDDTLSAYAIAKLLAKHELWVKKTAYNLEVYPEHVNITENRKGAVYPKVLLPMLRTIIQHAPPANDLYSMDEAEALLGRHQDWILRTISQNDLNSEMRTLAISHKVGIHMPKETVDALLKIVESAPYAGDWLTVNRMAQMVGRDTKWVHAHLGSYASTGEIRRDDNGKENIHYPPELLAYLQEIISQLPPYADDWVTIWAISKNLGRHVDWVKKWIEPYQDSAQIRLTNKGNRPLIHYPPEVQDALAQLG